MFARPVTHSEALGPGCAGPDLALAQAPPVSHGAGAGAGPRMHLPSSGAAPCAVEPGAVGAAVAGPHQHTQTPYVTGTSVLGLTYAGGVMLAADTLGSYGSTKRYKSVSRLVPVNGATCLGAGGELSDFQFILSLLDELDVEDYCAGDGLSRSPAELHSYLTRVLYNRRSKFDPLWNSLVVAGIDGATGKPFLGTVGMLGVAYTDCTVATGFGNHLARPLFREKHRPDMCEAEAEALLKEALTVCYYRDKQSINKFQIAKVTAAAAPGGGGGGGAGGVSVSVSEPFALETTWDYAAFVNPSAHATGTW